ncbi:MAG: hypothetical protein RTV31_04500 [Candidatus Thorarchaeota archaeon]
MDTKGLAIAWIVGIIGAWIIIGLASTAIVANLGGGESEGMDLLVSNLMDPTLITVSIILATIFTPCCYCYGKDS